MSLLSDMIEKQRNSIAFDVVQDLARPYFVVYFSLVFPRGRPEGGACWENRGRERVGLSFHTVLKIEPWYSV